MDRIEDLPQFIPPDDSYLIRRRCRRMGGKCLSKGKLLRGFVYEFECIHHHRFSMDSYMMMLGFWCPECRRTQAKASRSPTLKQRLYFREVFPRPAQAQGKITPLEAHHLFMTEPMLTYFRLKFNVLPERYRQNAEVFEAEIRAASERIYHKHLVRINNRACIVSAAIWRTAKEQGWTLWRVDEISMWFDCSDQMIRDTYYQIYGRAKKHG